MPNMMAEPQVLMRNVVLGFVAGALAVATLHQLMVFLLTQFGMIQGTVYSMRPIPPWGVPAILNQMFWGGLWGILFALVLESVPSARPIWLVGLLFGVIALPIVGWFVVAPIKGTAIAAGWVPRRMLVSVLINGGWGIAVAIIYILLARATASGRSKLLRS
jgi:hypothetical protein